MKITFNALLLVAFAVFAFATKQQQPLKPYIVSYPKGTPPRFLEEAKKAVIDAGGVITHEYNLIAGFACKTSKTVLESIEALTSEHKILIEEDQTMSINV